MMELTLTSPDFAPGDWMPDCTSAFEDNKSPELVAQGIDPGGVTIAITMDDMGHPLEPYFNHWVAWNIPIGQSGFMIIPGGIPRGEILDQPIHIEQGMAYGKHCYKGPKPPFNWNHDYVFTLYVIDTTLTISTDSQKNTLLEAIEGHIIQTAKLVGKYQKRHK